MTGQFLWVTSAIHRQNVPFGALNLKIPFPDIFHSRKFELKLILKDRSYPDATR